MLAVLLSPVGRWLGLAGLAIALVLGAYGYGRVKGHAAASAECRTSALRAEVAILKADLAAERAARADAAARSTELQISSDAAQGRLDALQTYIATLPAADRCLLGPDAVQRLLDAAR